MSKRVYSKGIPKGYEYWRNGKRGDARRAYKTLRTYSNGQWKLATEYGAVFETSGDSLMLFGYKPQSTRPSFFPVVEAK